MQQTATITSKRQLTIPASLFRLVRYTTGQQVLIRSVENRLVIEPASSLVDKLAGSVTVPKKFQNLTDKEIVSKAKKNHFRKVS